MKITSFKVAGVAATINHTAKTISVTVPHGTVVTALVPTIKATTGWTISPASGVATDFSRPVVYKIKKGTVSVSYTTTVTVAPTSAPPSDLKKITSFVVGGVAASINETAGTIALTVPHGTGVTAMVPTITTSAGATVSPATGRSQNFTAPVVYEVKAADGSIRDYVATVTVAPDPAIAAKAAKKKKYKTNALIAGSVILALLIVIGAVRYASSDKSRSPKKHEYSELEQGGKKISIKHAWKVGVNNLLLAPGESAIITLPYGTEGETTSSGMVERSTATGDSPEEGYLSEMVMGIEWNTFKVTNISDEDNLISGNYISVIASK